MSKSSTPTKITRDDLENKLRALQNDVQGKVDDHDEADQFPARQRLESLPDAHAADPRDRPPGLP